MSGLGLKEKGEDCSFSTKNYTPAGAFVASLTAPVSDDRSLGDTFSCNRSERPTGNGVKLSTTKRVVIKMAAKTVEH